MTREGFVVLCRQMATDANLNVIVIRGDDSFEVAFSVPKTQRVKVGDRARLSVEFKPSLRE